VPVWKALAERGRVPFKVYYLSNHGLIARHDPGFRRSIAWDIDLISGYDHEFLQEVVTGSDQSSFWWLRLGTSLGRRLHDEGAKVMWVQGWQVAAYWQALWQARNAGLRTWLRAETNLRSTRQGWRQLITRPALNQYFGHIDNFLYVGEANRHFYLCRGIDPGKLASTPYCVDNSRFLLQANSLKRDREALRAKWRISQDATCLLFVGKLIQKKRPLDLIAACRLIRERMPDRLLHLLFVGSGELLESLAEQCHVAYSAPGQRLGSTSISENDTRISATFAGFLNQSEISQAYVAADCLVLPSEATETWGLVVNEAMASGLPAVVSDAAGCSDDLIKPVRPDLCFPVGDRAGLAAAVVNCLVRPPKEMELKVLIDRYDIARTVEAVEALYAANP